MNREGELWLIKHPSPWSKLSSSENEYRFITNSKNIGNNRTLHTFIHFDPHKLNKIEDTNDMQAIEYDCLPWENRKDRTRIG